MANPSRARGLDAAGELDEGKPTCPLNTTDTLRRAKDAVIRASGSSTLTIGGEVAGRSRGAIPNRQTSRLSCENAQAHTRCRLAARSVEVTKGEFVGSN